MRPDQENGHRRDRHRGAEPEAGAGAPREVHPVAGAGVIADPDRACLRDRNRHHEEHRRQLVGDRGGGEPGGAEQPDQEGDGDEHAGLGDDCQPDRHADPEQPGGHRPVHHPEATERAAVPEGRHKGNVGYQSGAEDGVDNGCRQRHAAKPHRRNRTDAANEHLVQPDVEAQREDHRDDLRQRALVRDDVLAKNE